MSEYHDDQGSFFDTLRLSARDMEMILAAMDGQDRKFGGHDRRRETRFHYRRDSRMVVTVFHPGGSTVRYAVKPRNLSVNGVSFLHGGFLHLGTQSIVSLESRDGRHVNAVADVMRCAFVKRSVHEIGLKFREPIDLRQFLSAREMGQDSDDSDLPRLTGRILCIEPSIDDRELLSFMMERIGVQVVTVADGPQAQALIAGGLAFDVVLTELATGSPSGPELAAALSQGIPATPVIVLTANHGPETRATITSLGCAALIGKPFTLPQIHGVLLQYLALTESPAPEAPLDQNLVISEHWHDRSMRPLISRFLDRLGEQTQAIEKMVQDQQSRELRDTCQRLKGTAGSYGFPQISSAAAKLVEMTRGDVALESVRQQTQELVDLCRQATRSRDMASGA